MLNRGLDKLELLRIVEAVANEKSIDKELVIGSMESAIQKAALTKFGNDNDIEVVINRESGEIKIQKVLDIVEKEQRYLKYPTAASVDLNGSCLSSFHQVLFRLNKLPVAGMNCHIPTAPDADMEKGS